MAKNKLQKNENGDTVLHMLARQNLITKQENAQHYKEILQLTANIENEDNEKDSQIVTFFDLFKEQDKFFPKVIEIPLNKEILQLASKFASEENINEKNNQGETFLDLLKGQGEFFPEVIEIASKYNAKDSNSGNILHLLAATKSPNRESIKIAIKNSSTETINAINNDGKTALEISLHQDYTQPGNYNLFREELIFTRKEDIKIPNFQIPRVYTSEVNLYKNIDSICRAKMEKEKASDFFKLLINNGLVTSYNFDEFCAFTLDSKSSPVNLENMCIFFELFLNSNEKLDKNKIGCNILSHIKDPEYVMKIIEITEIKKIDENNGKHLEISTNKDNTITITSCSGYYGSVGPLSKCFKLLNLEVADNFLYHERDLGQILLFKLLKNRFQDLAEEKVDLSNLKEKILKNYQLNEKDKKVITDLQQLVEQFISLDKEELFKLQEKEINNYIEGNHVTFHKLLAFGFTTLTKDGGLKEFAKSLDSSIKQEVPELTNLALYQHALKTTIINSPLPGAMLLFSAYHNNNKEMFEFLLKHGANVNTTNKYDNNILHDIAQSSQIDSFGFLEIGLKYATKEDINKKNNDGNTLLGLAFKAKNLESFQLLLKHGADTSIINSNGENILHLTVKHPEFLKIAVEYSSKETINTKDNNLCHQEEYRGNTPLKLAFKAKNEESFKCLLKNSADVNCSTGDANILLEASYESFSWLVENGVDVNFTNEKGQNILHLKAMYGNRNKEALKYATKETINGKDQDGNTALMCIFKQAKTVKKINDLLKCGADISITNNNGENIFHLIAHYSKYYSNLLETWEYFDLIVKGDINQNTKQAVNQVDKTGNTPLMIAINKKDKELFKKLIENGADIINQNGHHVFDLITNISWFNIVKDNCFKESKMVETELMFTLDKGNEHEFEKLIENGADVSATNSFGQNIFHLIATDGNKAFFEIAANSKKANIATLNKQDVCGNTPLMIASKSGHKKLLGSMLTKKSLFDLGVTNKQGQNILHLEVSDVHSKYLKEVITKETINKQDNNGDTPLMFVSNSQDFEILLKNGADVTITNKQGQNIFHLIALKDAEHFSHNLNYYQIIFKSAEKSLSPEIIKKIINAKDNNGETIFTIALKNNNMALVKILIDFGECQNSCPDPFLYVYSMELLENDQEMAAKYFSKLFKEWLKSNSSKAFLMLKYYHDALPNKDQLLEDALSVITESPFVCNHDLIKNTLNIFDLGSIIAPLEKESFNSSRSTKLKIYDCIKILNFKPTNHQIDQKLLLTVLESCVSKLSEKSLKGLKTCIYEIYDQGQKLLADISKILDCSIINKYSKHDMVSQLINDNKIVVSLLEKLGVIDPSDYNCKKFCSNLDLSLHNAKFALKIIEEIRENGEKLEKIEKNCSVLSVYKELITKILCKDWKFCKESLEKIEQIFAIDHDSLLKQDLIMLITILKPQDKDLDNNENRFEQEKLKSLCKLSKTMKTLIEELSNINIQELNNILAKDGKLITNVIELIKKAVEGTEYVMDIWTLPIMNVEFEFVYETKDISLLGIADNNF